MTSINCDLRSVEDYICSELAFEGDEKMRIHR